MLLDWCDQVRLNRIGVRANADTREEATESLEAGADGIGCAEQSTCF